MAKANGIITDVSPVSMAMVTDGPSQTMMVTERALAPLVQLEPEWPDRLCYAQTGWWFSGDWGHTVMSTYFPPNSYKSMSTQAPHGWMWGGSSMHPGGLNLLMGDGSIRFVKDTVASVKFNPNTGIPVDLRQTSSVWQALGTRNGNELISSEAY